MGIRPHATAPTWKQTGYCIIFATAAAGISHRIFKLGQFVGEGEFIVNALRASRFRILVFLTAIFTLTIVMGTLMYVVEGGQYDFTSISKSVY